LAGKLLSFFLYCLLTIQ
jgi:polyamine oxidase